MPGKERAHAVVGAVEVGRDHRVPVVERQRLETALRHVDARGVDEHVDAARSARARPRPSRPTSSGTLTSHGNVPIRRQGFRRRHARPSRQELAVRPADQSDAPTLRCEPQRDRLPDAVPAPVTTDGVHRCDDAAARVLVMTMRLTVPPEWPAFNHADDQRPRAHNHHGLYLDSVGAIPGFRLHR